MEITTPNGTVVVLKDYITGRDERDIQAVLFSGMKIGQTLESIDPSVIAKSQDKAIEIVVVSVNGDTQDVVEKVLLLPREDFHVVKDAIDKITNGDEEKKTN